MPDRPGGTELLEIARRTLLDEVAPKLDGLPRFQALMAANAIQIVSRELAYGSSPAAFARSEEVGAALVEAIRRGDLDAEPATFAALLQDARHRALVWKPALVEPEDRLPAKP